MAVKQLQISVTDTPARIDDYQDADLKPGREMIFTPDVDLYVGDEDVTIEDGFKVAANGVLSVDLGSGDKLYGVCETSGNVSVLLTGV